MNTIETARVYLRPFTADDLDAFAVIGSDPDVMRYIGEGKPQSRQQTQARLNAIYSSDVTYYAITREEYERDDSTYIRKSEKG
ncbi:MAG: GNAT family N-acetyltransferase [Acidobacteriota bacterium]